MKYYDFGDNPSRNLVGSVYAVWQSARVSDFAPTANGLTEASSNGR